MTERRKGKRLSEAEINDIVISQARDPDAWEDPILVRPASLERRSRRKHAELAAKYFVLSVLHRLGADATLAVAEPDGGVDIVLVQESGPVVTIDVRTLAGTSRWPIAAFRARNDHFLVFVCYTEPIDAPQTNPEVYVVSSENLDRFLRGEQRDYLSMEQLDELFRARNSWQGLLRKPAA